MKSQTGQVTEFNQYSGKIQSNNKEYLLLDTNIIEEQPIQINDEVEFIPEKVQDINIARFVKKRCYIKHP